ncbi:MAG: hypothetical protein JSR39_06830 [Verrucomicrobia bacterium]|nr:hypothetical protein [Verrucomicrobiota bacterium]
MNENKVYISLAALVIIGLIGVVGCGPKSSPTVQEAPKVESEQVTVVVVEEIKPVEAPKKKPPYRAPQVQFNDKQFDPHSDVTPSARGCNNDTAFYMAGSFIYWKSSFTDTTISARWQNPGVQPNKFKKMSLDSQYDPGFKLGIGCNFHRDVWDIFLNWTWLQSNFTEKDHTHAPKLGTVLGNIVPQAQNVNLTDKFKARWHFEFDALDLEMGRNFYISKYISIRPFAGLKGAWIEHRLKMNYKNPIDPNNLPLQSSIHSKYKDHAWGIGPRLGINSRWVLGKSNFAFLANAAGSLIWEDFHPSSSTKFLDAQGIPPALGKIHGHQQELNPIAEVFLGFDWGKCFGKHFYMNLSAGYEMQYWWDQVKTSSFLDIQPSGALNLHGLTTTLRFDF